MKNKSYFLLTLREITYLNSDKEINVLSSLSLPLKQFLNMFNLKKVKIKNIKMSMGN